MNNGALDFDQLYRVKNAYDAIYEENSSYRQSLLVSPHYSKFEKQQSRYENRDAQNNGSENSLMEYIRPFQSQQLNKTQTKQKLRRKPLYEGDNRKRTEQDLEQKTSKQFSQNSLQAKILELKQAMKQKDERITVLQRNLAKLMSKSIIPTQATIDRSPHNDSIQYMMNFSKEMRRSPPKLTKNQKINHKDLSYNVQKSNVTMLELQIQNYKKQIRFLTHNNQQLYQQVQKINQHCEKMKKTLNKTILYTKELQQKIQQIYLKNENLQQLNQTLIQEKQQMMNNYQEELKLFQKMKKIWGELTENQKKQDEKKMQKSKSKSRIKQKERRQTKHTSSQKPRKTNKNEQNYHIFN